MFRKTPSTPNQSSLRAVSFRLRQKLPAKQPKRPGMWSILKKFAGADLGKVSLPVLLNEPITFLQRMMEPLDNIDTLFKALREPDPVERMSLVAAFIVASYCGTDERVWKPFNPLLGETYEVQRQSFRAISEKVSHHPPICAFYAEAPNIIFHGWVAPNFKFGGQTIDVTNRGSLTLKFTNLDEVYTWSLDNVLTRVTGVMFGTMAIENVGKLMVRNHKLGYRAVIGLIENNEKKNYINRAEGFIKDERGTKRLFIYGKYSRFLKSVDIDTYRQYVFLNANRFDGRVLSYFNVPQRSLVAYQMAKEKQHKEHHPINIPNSKYIWIYNDVPSYRDHYFNFSYFAFTLNEIEPYMNIPGILCPTDSRFRPDLRLYENGDVQNADLVKTKLEEAQRDRAKLRKDDDSWTPRWFYKGQNAYTGDPDWFYRGEYWTRNYPYDPVLNNLFVVR